ncbi:hypothetical protein CCP3SC15_1470008 [Gammaproteobacteria bacterium]
MAIFVEQVGGGKANNRVFLVELLPTEWKLWHPGIANITAVKCWSESLDQPEPITLGWPVPDPKSDKAYWREINNLASILARQIQNLPPIPQLPANPLPLPSAIRPIPSNTLSVVINADKPDRELGKRVQDLLRELEVEATLAAEPLPTQLPAEYHKHWEELLGYNHGVLIVYGVAPPIWVQTNYEKIKKVLAFQRKGIWGALVDGPPEQKPDHGLNSRNLMLLDCRRGITPAPLSDFVEKLRQGVAHV